MASAEASFVGISKQVTKGTPIILDSAFDYLLFSEGGISPASVTVPLDPEVGGGALLRDVQKMGVVSGGQFSFIPRPKTIGTLLLGALGTDTPTGVAAPYSHVFKLGADQFDAPYFTMRSAPGNMWGEQMQDCRVSNLTLAWRGANYLRGQFAIQGGLPTKVLTTAWAALSKVDTGPQFITPISSIELPTATAAKVLAGSFTAGLSIPLDEQWIVGSYAPDAYDIVARAFSLSMSIKVTDATLYSKMAYDPTGASIWAADMFREANFKIQFNSNQMAADTTPYSLKIAGNGSTGAAANVVWSVAPIALRAGRQVVMNVTGTFLADATMPVSVTLVNATATY